MTLADQIDRAVSHLGAAKAYAVSPRYVVEAVAGNHVVFQGELGYIERLFQGILGVQA